MKPVPAWKIWLALPLIWARQMQDDIGVTVSMWMGDDGRRRDLDGVSATAEAAAKLLLLIITLIAIALGILRAWGKV